MEPEPVPFTRLRLRNTVRNTVFFNMGTTKYRYLLEDGEARVDTAAPHRIVQRLANQGSRRGKKRPWKKN